MGQSPTREARGSYYPGVLGVTLSMAGRGDGAIHPSRTTWSGRENWHLRTMDHGEPRRCHICAIRPGDAHLTCRFRGNVAHVADPRDIGTPRGIGATDRATSVTDIAVIWARNQPSVMGTDAGEDMLTLRRCRETAGPVASILEERRL